MIMLLSRLAQASPRTFSQPSPSFSPTYVREDSKLIYIGNGFIELRLQKTDGSIYSVINKITGEDYRTNKLVKPRLFWFGNSSTGHDNFAPNSFQYGYDTGYNGSLVTLKYVFSGTEPATVTATVRVVANSSLSYWRISIDNPDKALIDMIDFPAISGIGQVGNQTTNNYLLLGDEAGSMVTDLYSTFITNSSSPPGVGSVYP